MAQSRAGTINLQTAAKLLMVSDQVVLNLVKSGHIEKAGRGQYPTVSVVQGYIRYLNEKIERQTKTAAQSRLSDSKAALVDVQLAERTGKLHREAMDSALARVDMEIGQLRSDMLAVPARVTADLALRRKIETAIDDAFRSAANRAGSRPTRFGPGAPPVDADENDDA